MTYPSSDDIPDPTIVFEYNNIIQDIGLLLLKQTIILTFFRESYYLRMQQL